DERADAATRRGDADAGRHDHHAAAGEQLEVDPEPASAGRATKRSDGPALENPLRRSRRVVARADADRRGNGSGEREAEQQAETPHPEEHRRRELCSGAMRGLLLAATAVLLAAGCSSSSSRPSAPK